MPLEPIVPEITTGTSGVAKHREGLEELEADSPSNTPSKGMEILNRVL
jgi:hypothetical protein